MIPRGAAFRAGEAPRNKAPGRARRFAGGRRYYIIGFSHCKGSIQDFSGFWEIFSPFGPEILIPS